MWKDQLGIIPKSTYAPDLYEFGDDIQRWAENCIRQVHQESVVVVGCSVGGSCALEILNLAPDRVAATILIGTKARHDPDPAFALEARRIIENQGVEAAWRQLWEPLFSRPDNGDAHATAEAIALDQSPMNLLRGLTAFHARTSREYVVAKSNSPVHIVSGDQDEFPGLEYSQRLAAQNSKAKLHIIEDCGHYVPMVRPFETNALIAKVISEATTV